MVVPVLKGNWFGRLHGRDGRIAADFASRVALPDPSRAGGFRNGAAGI
jgi:hypothetical protein